MTLEKLEADMRSRFGPTPAWVREEWGGIMIRGYWQGLREDYLREIPVTAYLDTARQYAALLHRNLDGGDRARTCMATWPPAAMDTRVDRMRRMLDSEPVWINGIKHPVLRTAQVYTYLGLLCWLAAWRSESDEEGKQLLQLANRFHHINGLLPNMPRTAVEHLELALSKLFGLPEDHVLLQLFCVANTEQAPAPRLSFGAAWKFSFRSNLQRTAMWQGLWKDVLRDELLTGLWAVLVGVLGLLFWAVAAPYKWLRFLVWAPLRNALWRRETVSTLANMANKKKL